MSGIGEFLPPSLRAKIQRHIVALAAAFSAFTLGWVIVGFCNTGDAFPQGLARPLLPLPFLLAALGWWMAYRFDNRLVRSIVGSAAGLAIAFWVGVPDGWWALAPPPPSTFVDH